MDSLLDFYPVELLEDVSDMMTPGRSDDSKSLRILDKLQKRFSCVDSRLRKRELQ